MPREVNTEKRLADIAAATVRVARTAGAQSVTIRSVARELGGSTTLVTNYLPSRAALIMNALDQGRDRWLEERRAVVAASPPGERLAALIDWSLSATSDDSVLRTLILEIVANARVEPEMRESLHRESVEFQQILESTASESGFADARHVAELLYIIVRGAYIATVEDPEHWNEDRVRGVVHSTISTLPRRHDATQIASPVPSAE
ncbi:TetR family transcriptional regulator C-terminal domain-containing protein [Arthrobacter koreensis]|uniref:TetR/AcrR family transcriptional regulator n=1 Tax=Arthrobacter koreensis TaxID=199136 RepID=UPI002DBEDE1B|nr:TetR family transcriptional regulator C-terminal domain-containing protein [Arthrobacter koreensis]MEB7505764.1 TetR family transcriptional regulator C-terminal domain-containing protein [Arthrobacter koreensis]